jgi:hypothetical protein
MTLVCVARGSTQGLNIPGSGHSHGVSLHDMSAWRELVCISKPTGIISHGYGLGGSPQGRMTLVYVARGSTQG